MKVTDLSKDQLTELKQRFYDDKHPEGVSYGELAAIDQLVSDDEIIAAYEGVDFVPDDFFTDKGGSL